MEILYFIISVVTANLGLGAFAYVMRKNKDKQIKINLDNLVKYRVVLKKNMDHKKSLKDKQNEVLKIESHISQVVTESEMNDLSDEINSVKKIQPQLQEKRNSLYLKASPILRERERVAEVARLKREAELEKQREIDAIARKKKEEKEKVARRKREREEEEERSRRSSYSYVSSSSDSSYSSSSDSGYSGGGGDSSGGGSSDSW